MTWRGSAIDQIYLRLPRLNCQRKCQQSCGPVPMFPAEWERVVQTAGAGRLVLTPEQAATLTCPLLTADGFCSVYHVRPILCRLFGLVKAMRCPWGCKPSRWLTDKEARAIIRQVQAIQPGPPRSAFPGLDEALRARLAES